MEAEPAGSGFVAPMLQKLRGVTTPKKSFGVVKRNFQTWLRKETDRKCGTSGYDINLLLIGLLVGLGLMSWFRVGARSSGQLKVCGGGSLLISVAEKKHLLFTTNLFKSSPLPKS